MERSRSWTGLAGLCIETALRLGLGGMFLYSAWGKIHDPWMFQTAVDNYRFLPACTTAVFAVAMPMAELLVGAMLVFTKWTREAAFATAVMLMMFIVALLQAQVRGLDISCGCFGESEEGPGSTLYALVRDVLLLALTAWLMFNGKRRWLVDFRSGGASKPPRDGV